MPGHRRPDPSNLTLADHARAWSPPGEDPGLAIDKAINVARSIRRDHRADRLNGERERDEWNARYPIGQAVLATGPGETCYRGRTTSVACLPAGNIPAVEVIVPGRPPGFWPLSYLQPVDELPTEWNPPTGGTDPWSGLPGDGFPNSSTLDAAAESERPGVLPVAPAAPGPRTKPDALAVLCHALGVEFLALAEARRDGKSWDDGHWRRLRGAVEAAGVVLEAGPRAEREGGQP